MEDSTMSLTPIISYFVIVVAVYWGGKYSYYRKMRRIKKNRVLSSTAQGGGQMNSFEAIALCILIVITLLGSKMSKV